ncbi:hypothetical protein, partial [Pararhodospirillum oryzae]|uniref:hypothetical protein n=1 Tax=Pararhodospirillum oryzae TaxID=478448 RepID=UPI00147894AD
APAPAPALARRVDQVVRDTKRACALADALGPDAGPTQRLAVAAQLGACRLALRQARQDVADHLAARRRVRTPLAAYRRAATLGFSR